MSPPLAKELLEQRRGLGFGKAAVDFRPVMAGRRREKLHAVIDRPALRVGRAVIEPADAGERHRAGAHGARLERHIEVAGCEPLGTEQARGRADRHHLGVRGRIGLHQCAVAGPRHHRAVMDDDATDRHLARFAGGASLVERQFHERCHGPLPLTVMPGLVPGIHVFIHRSERSHGWPDKPGHDEMAEKTKSPADGERIARAIARAGLCSRREAEEWIAAGRVAVNGEVIHSPALNVKARDRIAVDGEALPARERTRLFLYHKPRGLITTHSDPQGRPTIFARLPNHLPRLISVGRLDFNTEGLLLLTNDGALARVLELPSTGWLRRYRVRAHGVVTQPQLDTLREGVTISGIHYGAIDAALDRVQGANLWLTFAIREGKNREVRNVLGHLGLTVTRLIRVSFGPFQLGELDEGAIEEVRTRTLRDQLGDRLIAQSGADFSSARVDKPRQERKEPREGKDRKAVHHAWRAPADVPAKPLRRQFHGAHRKRDETHERTAEVRAGTLTDRKGRSVAVERFGQKPSPPPQPQESPPKRGRGGAHPRRWRDRASGPRPSHPKHPRGR